MPRILFGRVREDTALEASLASRRRCVCIASGGETAFDLLLGGATEVTAVDVNPSQTALVSLKATIFRNTPPGGVRDAFTLDGRPALEHARNLLQPDALELLEFNRAGLRLGLDRCGVIDAHLSRALALFRPLFLPSRIIREMLSLTSLDQQRDFFRSRWDTPRWRFGIRTAFHPLVLKRIFGNHLTKLVPSEFGEMVSQDFEHLISNVPLHDNRFFWQTLLNELPHHALPPWLTDYGLARMGQLVGRLEVQTIDLSSWLLAQPAESIDLVCASNILDGAEPDAASRLGESLAHALAPNGMVVVRSLFSLPGGIEEASMGALQPSSIPEWTDRSLFCRKVAIWRRSP